MFMLQSLKSAGVESRLLCLTKGEPIEDEIRELGIDIRPINTRLGRLITLRNVVKEVRRAPTDIVQSSHFYTNIYVSIAGRLNGIPSIGAIRSDLTAEIAENGLYGKYQLRLPQHLIANSKLAVERSINLGIAKNQIDLVRNVVSFGGASRLSLNGKKGPMNIVFVGRLVKQKRPDLFVDLASILRKAFPEGQLRFQMVGSGGLRSSLEAQARALDLGPESLTFEGELGDMSEIYRQTDILVLPSVHEGTPNVVLEALSHGIPVVATRVGGVPEILNEGTGIVVDPTDLQGLVTATTKLIRDRGLRLTLGKNGQDYVRQNHSLSYLQDRLNGIYSRLMAEGPRTYR